MGNSTNHDRQRYQPGFLGSFIGMPQRTGKGVLFAPVPVRDNQPGPCYLIATELWFQLQETIYDVLLPQHRVIDRNGNLIWEISILAQRTAVQQLEILIEQFAGPLIKSGIETLAKRIAGDITSTMLPPDEFLSADEQAGTLLHLLKNPVVDGQPVSHEAQILVKQLTAACNEPRWTDSLAKVRTLGCDEIIVLNRLSYKYLGFRLKKFGEIDLNEKAVILAWVYEHFNPVTGKPK